MKNQIFLGFSEMQPIFGEAKGTNNFANSLVFSWLFTKY